MNNESKMLKTQENVEDNYTLLETKGYIDKEEAFQRIKRKYGAAGRVTTYFYDGIWYIVQNNVSK